MKHWLRPLLKSSGTFLATVALASAALMAQGGGAGGPQGSPESNPATSPNDAAFRRVSNRLLCQCGCGYMVLSCNHVDCSSAGFIRKTISTKLAAGVGEDAIVAGFIEQYGPRIMPEPPKKGFALSAWVMPFAVLVLGGTLISFFLLQWNAKSRAAEAGAQGEVPSGATPVEQNISEAAVEKYRAQIDRELENE
jgi:cytochrome c-type biogenesis protein CcmH/NrfF